MALQQILPVWKVPISPFTCNVLDDASLFYPFFAVTSLYFTDNTRDG